MIIVQKTFANLFVYCDVNFVVPVALFFLHDLPDLKEASRWKTEEGKYVLMPSGIVERTQRRRTSMRSFSECVKSTA